MGGLCILLFMGACVALLLQSAFAATYTVGDSSGWTIPTANAQLYTSWITGKTFKIGDELVFNFQSGAHDVMQVTKANYDSCGKTNYTFESSTPPVRITLNSTGAHYYICSYGAHCTNGQKVTITVAASTPSPSASPSPSPSAATSPPPSATSPPPSATSPPTSPSAGSPGGSTPTGQGPSASQPPSPSGDNSSASRLTASLGILSGVAVLFFL